MSLTNVFSFDDPDAYQQRVRATNAAILTSTRGDFRAGLAQVTFDRLWMQWGYESLPRIVRSSVDPNRAIVFFNTDPRQLAVQVGGQQIMNDNVVVMGKGTTNIMRTDTSSQWASMSLSHTDLAAAGEAITGREMTCPSDTYLFAPSHERLSRLRAIHAQAIRLAMTAPDTLAAPAVAKAVEEQALHVLLSTLADNTAADRRWLPGHHARIVARFEAFLESRPGQPIYLAEICAAIGTSERTLRTACHEVLGVGPVRFLWLRRMHLARQALRHAEPATTSVTRIATALGFWELGRFSVEYRALFGESPSTSLRRVLVRPLRNFADFA